jgi:ribosomal protein S12 methylthiotransferase
MKRPAHAENTLARIRAWRGICPELTLRSTFIVGFPGETEQDFELLLEWLAETQLDRVGCFKYSPVEGAAANALPGAVPDELKQERYDRFMELSRSISVAKLAAKVGRRMRVLVDEIGDGGAVARSAADAPEIDGTVRIPRPGRLKPGDWAEVEITGAGEYDLSARIARDQVQRDRPSISTVRFTTS